MDGHGEKRERPEAAQEVPELVTILKRLAAHRFALWERTYGKIGLAHTLSKTIGDFHDALEADDLDVASGLLRRLIQEAGVPCSAEARQATLTRLRDILEARRAALDSGDKSYNRRWAELGPEASEAFDLWNRLHEEAGSQEAREARTAYWWHPLQWLCRELEERLGIEREALETAAYRLNSTLGLRGMEPFPAPDGTIADKGQPDWLWMLPKFKELDRDGTTARLWKQMQGDYAVVLNEANVLPGEAEPGAESPPNEETQPADYEADLPLGERAQLVLTVLLEKEAFDSDHRQTTEDIAVAAVGPDADPNQFKEVIASLRKAGYVGTREGRGGGCWLTELGRQRAEKL